MTSPTLGAAETRWNDYRGTAAADDAVALRRTRSLHEIAGLDRSRWDVVGIDASLAGPGDRVVVYAVDRDLEPTPQGSGPGELGVTAFHLSPSTRAEEFLREAFAQVTLRLVATAAAERGLRVDEHVELDASQVSGAV